MSGSIEVSGGTGVLLVLVFLSELAMLAGLAVLGATMGDGPSASITLGIAFPLLVAAVWGVLLAPKSVVGLPVVLQVSGKVVLMGGTALGVVAIGQPLPGNTFGLVGIVSVIAAFRLTGSN